MADQEALAAWAAMEGLSEPLAVPEQGGDWDQIMGYPALEDSLGGPLLSDSDARTPPTPAVALDASPLPAVLVAPTASGSDTAPPPSAGGNGTGGSSSAPTAGGNGDTDMQTSYFDAASSQLGGGGERGGTSAAGSKSRGSKRGPRPRLFKKNACQADDCGVDLANHSFYYIRCHICPVRRGV